MDENIKKYKLSTMDQVILWLKNYDLSEPLSDSIRFVRYHAMDTLVSNIVASHDKNFDEDQDFLFTLIMDPLVVIELKKYLMKQKKLVLKYITTGHNMGSHLYQFYLQYTADELSVEEKRIFLENYLNMVKDLRGTSVSKQKGEYLERRLNLIKIEE